MIEYFLMLWMLRRGVSAPRNERVKTEPTEPALNETSTAEPALVRTGEARVLKQTYVRPAADQEMAESIASDAQLMAEVDAEWVPYGDPDLAPELGGYTFENDDTTVYGSGDGE